MPRSEARMFTSIWNDQDWRSFGPDGRDAYALLLTQVDLTPCGVIPLREERWADMADLSLEQARASLAKLERAQWTVVDRVSGELLVRSLIRRDRVLRSPKMWKPLLYSVGQVYSLRLRSVILSELIRTRAEGGVNERIYGEVDQLIDSIKAQVNTLSGSHSHTPCDAVPGSQPDAVGDAHPDTPQGGGARYGSSPTIAPYPNSPSPRPANGLAADAAFAPAPAQANSEGEEATSGPDPDPAIAGLVAEIRAVRPEWTTASIRRSLTHPDVRERPAGLVAGAALAVARDRASQSPGRLSHDGPWWHQPGGSVAVATRPEWCGECDERTRQIGDPDKPERCPRCHSASRKEPAA